MTKLEELIKKIIKFNKARGWTPQEADLAKSIVIESAELLEHYQWDESDRDIKGTGPKNYEEIGEEVADVFWYLVTFCEAAGIDLKKAIKRKAKKNAEKYPVNMFKRKHNDEYYKSQKRKYRKMRNKLQK